MNCFILYDSYRLLTSVCSTVPETFESVNSVILHQIGGYESGNSASVSYPSRFSLR